MAVKGEILSEEVKSKMSIAKKGIPLSETHKRHLRVQKSTPSWAKGKPKYDKRGAGNHAWKGGIGRLYRSLRGVIEYKQWRSAVFERDGWKCRTCGIFGVYVTAHHIKSFRKIIRENNIKSTEEAMTCQELWDITNGITLCEPCHSLTDNYKGRANSRVSQ